MENGNEEWISLYLKDLKKNQDKAADGGEAAILSGLKSQSLLPILTRKPIKGEIATSDAERGSFPSGIALPSN